MVGLVGSIKRFLKIFIPRNLWGSSINDVSSKGDLLNCAEATRGGMDSVKRYLKATLFMDIVPCHNTNPRVGYDFFLIKQQKTGYFTSKNSSSYSIAVLGYEKILLSKQVHMSFSSVTKCR